MNKAKEKIQNQKQELWQPDHHCRIGSPLLETNKELQQRRRQENVASRDLRHEIVIPGDLSMSSSRNQSNLKALR